MIQMDHRKKMIGVRVKGLSENLKASKKASKNGSSIIKTGVTEGEKSKLKCLMF